MVKINELTEEQLNERSAKVRGVTLPNHPGIEEEDILVQQDVIDRDASLTSNGLGLRLQCLLLNLGIEHFSLSS